MENLNKNKTLAEEHLKKIASSPLFCNSPRYVDLLTFLVEKALAGEHLKEYTIGVDFFKKRYKNETSDSVVRVNMHNLRKKLAEYYNEDGKNDTIRFEFEQRNYNLLIRNAPKKKTNTKKRLLIGVCSGAIFAALLVLFINNKSQNNFFWSDFFDKGKPTVCVLANHLALSSRINGDRISLFHQGVITQKDFEEYKSSGSLDSVSIAGFSFFTKSIPYAMQRLSFIFGKHDHDFAQIAEGDFHLAESKNTNIIYVGQPKLMNNSKYIFLQNSKKFTYKNFDFYSVDGNNELTRYNNSFKISGRQLEYGMVSYMPTYNGFKALFFTSDNDIGIMAAIDKFTNRQFLEKLYSNFDSEDSYFNVLYKVEGLDRTEIDFKIIQIEEIHNSDL